MKSTRPKLGDGKREREWMNQQTRSEKERAKEQEIERHERPGNHLITKILLELKSFTLKNDL